MSNDYIHNLKLSEDNNKLIIYFKNNIYNCELDSDQEKVSIFNFRLHLLSNNYYKDITILDILKIDNSTYTLFFDISNEYINSNSVILVELISLYDNNLNLLYKYQKNNHTYINYNPNKIKLSQKNLHTIDYNLPKKIYINKSSPLLAYQNNQKLHYMKQIKQYHSFYGQKISKYPKSYYKTAYQHIFKPAPIN